MNSILLLAAMAQFPVADAPGTIIVFGRQQWFQTAKGDTETFNGILERIPGTGATSRTAFVLTMALEGKNTTRDIFIGGDNRALVPYANRRVRVTGMAVDLKVDGRMKYEIWPAKIEIVGGAVGPPIVIGGIGGNVPVDIVASTNWSVPIPRVGAIPRLGTGHIQQVARSQDELVRILGNQQNANNLIKALGLQGIDYTTQMVILLSGGIVQGPGHSVEVTSVDMVDRIMFVRWVLRKPGGQPVNINNFHPGRVIVVARSDFPVRFDPPAQRFP
jgi:hypothetical protein